MTEPEFIEKTTELFLKNGAKSLTMDDVAKEFGISKKTLYQKYSTKENLLEKVLELRLEHIIEKLKKQHFASQNALDNMLCRDEEIDEVAKRNKSLFIRQLLKYYPNMFEKHMGSFSQKFCQILTDNIQKGREQGWYHYDFDEKSFASLFFRLIISFDYLPYSDTNQNAREIFNAEVFSFYMNAITTEKGKNYLKQLNYK